MYVNERQEGKTTSHIQLVNPAEMATSSATKLSSSAISGSCRLNASWPSLHRTTMGTANLGNVFGPAEAPIFNQT